MEQLGIPYPRRVSADLCQETSIFLNTDTHLTPFGLTAAVPVTVGTWRLSSGEAGKVPIFTLVRSIWGMSDEIYLR